MRRTIEKFDINSIKNESLKGHYENILRRGVETIQSLGSAYKSDRKAPEVDVFYYNSRSLNAFADKEGEKYLIGITSTTIPLLTALFDKLLSFPFVLPELPANDVSGKYEIPFILDIKKGDRDTLFRVELTEERSLMSSLLSDLCVDFILLHEVGHIICGHIEGNATLVPEELYLEFSSFQKRGKFLRKSWEYEADIIASMLLVQHLDTLVRSSRKLPHLQNLFGLPDERVFRARFIALANVSLFTLFVYLNRLSLELGKFTYHPSPLVRINYIKDFVAGRAKRDWNIEIPVVEKFQDEYLDQILEALENISAFDCEKIFDEFEDRLEISTKQLHRGFKRFRGYCEKWSWVPKQSWS